ncbi:hypothetical protein SteCoe_5577 [Stentor coeruleus]|uniref:Peptidase C1A papain C-terminal domain-containing protein n=1 Tax=Stentor coeruleus TaxID=5963 RepID=A0A1R2CS00_9CILI|nr:hypothetical protein SteCoe_5577 [Stentor coeruleus]
MFFIFIQLVSAFKTLEQFNFKLPVSEVKNERNCNASYIFASTSALESSFYQNKILPNTTNLSDQYVLSILEANCTGDTLESAIKVLSTNGTTLESTYPYYGQGIYISSDKNMKYYISNYENSSMNKSQFIQKLNTTTLIVRFRIDNIENLVNYDGESYYNCENLGNDVHYMLAVQYDSDSDIVYLKNNWGLGWGNAGYLLLSLNENNTTSNIGPCGIYQNVTWINEIRFEN